MAYPGELGEDGYVGGETRERGFFGGGGEYGREGYGRPGYGGEGYGREGYGGEYGPPLGEGWAPCSVMSFAMLVSEDC